MKIHWQRSLGGTFVLLALYLLSGCAADQGPRRHEDASEVPQAVEFGSYCSLPRCADCSVGGCPLSGSVMVGSSCTCNIFDGPRNGVVVGQ